MSFTISLNFDSFFQLLTAFLSLKEYVKIILLFLYFQPVLSYIYKFMSFTISLNFDSFFQLLTAFLYLEEYAKLLTFLIYLMLYFIFLISVFKLLFEDC